MNRIKQNRFVGVVIVFILASMILAEYGCSSNGKQESSLERPNILIIMADDMGYSDIGCFGGEITTPSIDQLAANGLRYTQFYNAGRCCPTRASLLTGLYSHQTGMGWMTAGNLGAEGYTGEINNQCVTLAEVLREAGYSTYMVGKCMLLLIKTSEPMDPKTPGRCNGDLIHTMAHIMVVEVILRHLILPMVMKD